VPSRRPPIKLNSSLENSQKRRPSGRRLELRLLGPFVVLVDGAPVRFGRRPRAALAALVLRRGETVSTESLIESVWEGGPPPSARSVLHVYVSQLRRVLPPDRIVTEQSGYRFIVEAAELDSAEFERLHGEGRRALGDGNLNLAASRFSAALALWRGEALADLHGERFARDEAARLNELRLACFEGRFDTDLRLGRHGEIVPDLVRFVAEHPLRERLRGQLMTALYRAGRQADALACYREGRAALVLELGLEPGPELRALERRILDHDPVLGVPTQPAPSRPRVPAPQTPTVGRDREIAEVRQRLLEPRTRLVTLTGPGGVGKTRLAVELANALNDELSDGAALVDLAPLTDPEQLLPAIGHALGLREADATGWSEMLGEHLGERELLLVLDNLEHLVEGAVALSPLLDAAPRLTLLVTSRRLLRLSAEHVVDVRPLDVAAARELLASRAAAAGVTLDVDDGVLAELCDRLEGMPLAIELAAPWFRTLSAADLLSLLDSRLAVLSNGPRDAPRRQQTMRSTIDWGFDLLDPASQHLLGRMSLFRRGFPGSAALEVGGPAATMEALERLVESSIVQSSGAEFSLLEVVREYAHTLASADREGHHLHASYFLELAETAEPELVGADQGRWLEKLEASHDDLRGALEWFASSGDARLELRLATALGRFWYIRGYLSEGLAHLRGSVDRALGAHPELTANALRSASALAVLRGDYQQARDLVEDALELYRELADSPGIVRSLSNLGAILHGLGELEAAAATLDECILAAESLGEPRLIALARNNRGDVALSQREFEIARREFERSLALLREANDVANVARSLYNLGVVALQQRRPEAARKLLLEALDLSDGVDDKEDIAWSLIALATVGATSDRLRDAAVVLGFARALLERINATSKPFERHLDDITFERLAAVYGQAELEELLGLGARMPAAEGIALARSIGASDARNALPLPREAQAKL
jgi:predicted ATPase/DNA-binding SARP family transcriptional activator